jgi:glycosyltransferase involved in cell wall biosynthesis
MSFLWPILRFLLAASWWLTRQHWRRPYQLVHVHNVPDFLVFAAWYPKLTGARIILDIHDIVPEFYASKFSVSSSSWLVTGLKWMERLSGAFANHVILANHLWLDLYTRRSADSSKCSVFINHVDTSIFRSRPHKPRLGGPVVLFPGGLQWHQGVDIALQAFRQLRSQIPTAEFHIYGDGGAKATLVKLAGDLGLNGSVRFFDPKPLDEIAQVMASAELGVVPKRADSFGNEAYSTKIMEFMAVGVPVVVSSTKIDRYYFNDDVVRFFESGNHEALARAMKDLLVDETARTSLATRASEFAQRNSWDKRKTEYYRLVDSLCRRDERGEQVVVR